METAFVLPFNKAGDIPWYIVCKNLGVVFETGSIKGQKDTPITYPVKQRLLSLTQYVTQPIRVKQLQTGALAATDHARGSVHCPRLQRLHGHVGEKQLPVS